MKKKLTIIVIILAVLLLGLSFSELKVEGDDNFRTDNHNDLTTSFNPVAESNYLTYSLLREDGFANFNNYVNQANTKVVKTIMFASAEDLYNWSRDLAYNSTLSVTIKNILANSDYTLGLDIDYSQMKAQRFIPIGYDTYGQELKFSGTFDGRGFEISNLDFVNYGEYSFTIENEVYVYSSYFSMFNYNLGTIKNLGLIDPVIYLSNENVTLRDFAYLVGENSGTVESVYVIDNRTFGNAGMQISSIKVEEATRKRAAGILHTNLLGATFKNSYFSGISVVHGDFMVAILEEPIYYFDYSNQGIYDSVVYNSTRYGQGVPLDYYQVPNNPNSNTESELINDNNDLDDNWFNYIDDYGGLPRLFGLTTDATGTKYLITNAVDFIVFNKLLGYHTAALNNKGYNEQTYYLTNDINMAEVSALAYRLTENVFSGTFTADPLVLPQINNLTIYNGLNIDDGYHVGLFYILSGTFENIRLYNYTLNPNAGKDYVGQTFYVGSIAAKLHEGTIENVSLDLNFNFEKSRVLLGAYAIGGVAGEASGSIKKIYISNDSQIVINTLTYESDNKISNASYLGGVVGKTTSSKLALYNIKNTGSIENLNANQLYLNNQISHHIGGVIGYANNTNLVKHDFGLLTNTGSITYHSLTANQLVTTYLGGVIGLSSGMMYEFNQVYGKFSNEGTFVYENSKSNHLYVAGVLNSNHESAVEYVQISNDNNLTISHANIYASALINHLSNTKLTVSQANSYGNITYDTVNNQNIAGAIYTSSNSELQLNFINVETNIFVDYSDNSSELSVAGLTLNQNANYLNVIYGGTIQVEITNNNTSLVWVAGITKVLSANKLMKNALNEGTIYVYVKTTNTTNSVIKNLYVGGLVNINEAGDLHSSSQSQSMPKASQGIINSINRALITSYFKNYQGIEGRINTFAGGITSINKGSIQDVVNTGDIRFSNYTNGTASQFVTIDESDVYQGGKTIMYKTGVVIGGIASVVTSGYSRIYDSINSGNILAQSYYYTRSGGILGVVSPFDVSAGSVYGYTESHNVALDTHLKHSVISNGINYGDIYAISTVIGTYTNNSAGSNSERLYLNISANDTWPSNTTSSPAVNMSTRSSSTDRIAIYSAAGGIIGSGLSVLKRMINHGLIGATDAAGGIIGSIFVFTERNWNMAGRTSIADNAAGVTIVNINTAINYGDIKAVKNTTTIMQAIYNLTDGDISVISGVFYDFDDDFITPLNSKLTNKLEDSVRLYPEYKRGFGGVIGRIQRGGNQNMVTEYIGFTT
ncbi:MAG: hypothetical protein GX794_01755 [Acholeplasmataceae bacterium]|nr:hypothetical protein [Acholeplasmataceae bacterium]